jgi:DNA-binding MarR family transcriptional regulator
VSSTVKKAKKDLVFQVMMAGRENGTRSILFQQTVGQTLGISATDIKCMDVISLSGPSTPSQLAELTGLTTGAVTGLIDRLEKAGLLARKPDSNDRRKTVLVPTRQAMKKIPPLYASMTRAMGELTSQYSEQELELLLDYFGKVGELFRNEADKLKSRLRR